MNNLRGRLPFLIFLNISCAELGSLIHLVAAVGSTARQSAAGTTSGRAASEYSSVEARATAGNRVRVAKKATAAEEEREGQRETCRESLSRQESEGRYCMERVP